jgi:putative glutamine amidotransferase
VKPRIAIPVPHSQKPDYAQRSLPQYLSAISAAGGEPVVIQLTSASEQIARTLRDCDAVLLPGSSADVDPQKYGATKRPETADADQLRDAADELLLQDAYNLRKPIFGICYGLQSLNVWRTGTLVQDIAAELHSPVNHEAGRTVSHAHDVEIESGSQLGEIVSAARIPVNSSHHQAAQVVGDGLRVVARSSEDKIIEAVEGSDPEHFVLAVQWHPERTYDDEPASRALFRAFISAAKKKAS